MAGLLDSLFGGGNTMQTTQTTAGLSPWSQPFVSSMLGAAQQQVFNTDPITGQVTSIVPYLAYGAPVAGSPYKAGMGPGEQAAAQAAVAAPGQLQNTAYNTALGLQTPDQFGTATDIGTTAGLGLLNTAGQAQGLQNLGMQAVQQGQRYAQDITDPTRTAQFMSPYMQNVVDVQQQQARRQANIANQLQQAQAARSGAFGGGRDAIMRAQAAGDLQRNLQNIQAQGLQAAFQNAQAQQQQAQQQAMTGLQTGIQGYGQGIQGQTGAYGQAVGAGTGLGSLGVQQLGAQQAIANLQNTLGQQEQANRQAAINQAMQNFQLQKMYPQQQLQYLSSMLSGLPVSSTGQVASIPGPTGMQNLASLGLTAYGMNSMFPTLGKTITSALTGSKDGGMVSSYADGGSVTSQYNKDAIVRGLHPMGLPRAIQGAMLRGDMPTAQTAQGEMSLDNAIRRGIAAAAPYDMDHGYASGGIVAFSGGGAGGNNENEDEFVSTPGTEMRIPVEDLGVEDLVAMQGEGDPNMQRAAVNRAMALNRAIGTFAPTTMTPEEEDAYAERQYKLAEKLAGPSITPQVKEYLKQANIDRGQTLEQGKGLAALKAAGAILRPGGFMRGLGAAGEAFAGSYEKTLQADRAEKHALKMAEFNLMDADRKERMGYTKDAMASLSARRKNLQDADKLRLDKLRYQQQGMADIAKATRPIAQRQPPVAREPKFTEDLWAKEQQLATMDPSNPKYESLKKVVEAGRQQQARMRTTDAGPGRLALDQKKLLAATSKTATPIANSRANQEIVSKGLAGKKDPKSEAAIKEIRNRHYRDVMAEQTGALGTDLDDIIRENPFALPGAPTGGTGGGGGKGSGTVGRSNW